MLRHISNFILIDNKAVLANKHLLKVLRQQFAGLRIAERVSVEAAEKFGLFLFVFLRPAAVYYFGKRIFLVPDSRQQRYRLIMQVDLSFLKRIILVRKRCLDQVVVLFNLVARISLHNDAE